MFQNKNVVQGFIIQWSKSKYVNFLNNDCDKKMFSKVAGVQSTLLFREKNIWIMNFTDCWMRNIYLGVGYYHYNNK